MLMLTRLRDGNIIEGDYTLTEQGLEKIIVHACDVRIVYILSRARK